MKQLLFALVATVSTVAAQEKPKAEVNPSSIAASIRRGVDFLIADQNDNGSWGGATRTKGLNIYAPLPGAHHAFRAGASGLALSGLIDSGETGTETLAAIAKGRVVDGDRATQRSAVPTRPRRTTLGVRRLRHARLDPALSDRRKTTPRRRSGSASRRNSAISRTATWTSTAAGVTSISTMASPRRKPTGITTCFYYGHRTSGHARSSRCNGHQAR